MPHDSQQLWQVLRYTLDATNTFFKVIYHQGLWMTTEAAKVAVANGYKAVATLLDEKILLYIYIYIYIHKFGVAFNRS